jgi:hypothetical protein
MESKKILLYKVRNFSEKFDDTFAFVRENWKVLFKYLTYLILPVSLLQAIALNGYIETTFSISDANNGDPVSVLQSLGWSYGGMILTSLLGGMLLVSVVYGLITLSGNGENSLAGITADDLKPQLLRNMKRSGLAFVVFFVLSILFIVVVVALAAAMSFWILLPIMFAVIAFSIPLMLFMPVYLLEDIPLLASLSKTLRLGFATWWSTFAIIVVLGIIVSFIQGVFALPFYIMIVAKTILGVQGSGSEFLDSAGYSFIMYLFGVLQSYATFLLMSLMAVGLALQYGHASEKEDHVTMEDNINRFEEL